jgi:hypothetical protein
MKKTFLLGIFCSFISLQATASIQATYNCSAKEVAMKYKILVTDTSISVVATEPFVDLTYGITVPEFVPNFWLLIDANGTLEIGDPEFKLGYDKTVFSNRSYGAGTINILSEKKILRLYNNGTGFLNFYERTYGGSNALYSNERVVNRHLTFSGCSSEQ